MKIGSYYYPEQWPREQWERDFDRMADMGMRITHFAEFAWFALEPAPGDFQFDWLSDCIEMARKRHIDVILCTPTAAPPIWLSEQYPEILPVDGSGVADRHGGRRHYTPTSVRMQEATFRIVTALAEKFGDHPAVIGWQIDNELVHSFDQGPHTHAAFQKWLERKYGTIQSLNDAWGNQFWNQYYTAFDQIRLTADRQPKYTNPHHHLDSSRFWSSAWADFVKLQADILKPKIGSRWISTNFMPFNIDCDPGEMRDSLSLYSWDSYPVTGWGSNHKDENFRLGDVASIEFVHDQMAAYNGRWALMEVQPGQTNWSGYPCLTYPGAVRLWLWTAIAHGCEFITVYRLRQPRFGIEMFHDGLLQHDGVSLSTGGSQFQQVASEVARLWSKNEPATPGPSTQPAAGLVLDFEQFWYYATQPQAKRFEFAEMLCQWHQALSRMGYAVKILLPDQPWPAELAIIVAPGMQMVSPSDVEKMQQYVAGGGNLVLTCRTALMDRNGQFFESKRAAQISHLIGGEVEAYDALPEGTWGSVTLDGVEHKWGV
ncbi:MAG TPA: beta-galactosidase, partial [Tepidisphaeraceae bacterium]